MNWVVVDRLSVIVWLFGIGMLICLFDEGLSLLVVGLKIRLMVDDLIGLVL